MNGELNTLRQKVGLADPKDEEIARLVKCLKAYADKYGPIDEQAVSFVDL